LQEDTTFIIRERYAHYQVPVRVHADRQKKRVSIEGKTDGNTLGEETNLGVAYTMLLLLMLMMIMMGEARMS
jgi:hypothetical protein